MNFVILYTEDPFLNIFKVFSRVLRLRRNLNNLFQLVYYVYKRPIRLFIFLKFSDILMFFESNRFTQVQKTFNIDCIHILQCKANSLLYELYLEQTKL
jgi:hypothetical protein